MEELHRSTFDSESWGGGQLERRTILCNGVSVGFGVALGHNFKQFRQEKLEKLMKRNCRKRRVERDTKLRMKEKTNKGNSYYL